MEADERHYIYRADFGNEADMARLIDQYTAFIPVVKLFHSSFQPAGNETILDIGCGPGSWVLDVAFHYPAVSVIGLEVDEGAVNYAMARAKSSGCENATFEVHDVTKALPISDASVDYVNISLANSFLLKEQWPSLLAECHRVLKPGGWLRSVEWLGVQTSSVAMHRLSRIYHYTLEKDGKHFLEIAPHLQPLLREAGFSPTPLAVHIIDFSEYAPIHKAMCEDSYVAASLVLPLIVKHNVMTREEYESLLAEMQKDMMLPGFYGLIYLSDIAAQQPD